MIYGGAPQVLGIVDASCPEMMYCQYLPIHIPEVGSHLPPHLEWLESSGLLPTGWNEGSQFVYATVKSMYVDGASLNRPGWHSDGFMTDDINFIWSDRSPTEFCIQEFHLDQDHELAMRQMSDQAREENIVAYPSKTLLRLDQGAIHRCDPNALSGYRTFVKISISKHKYNLKGNARNHGLDYHWDMFERGEARNHPTK